MTIELQEYTVDIPSDLAANILAYKESHLESNQCSNQGGWQVNYENDVPVWMQTIYSQIKVQLQDYRILHAWMNINGPGDSNRWHRHHIDDYTAVLYVQVPENSGKMEFRVDRVDYPIQPVVGKLFVFSSNYMHCVRENKSADNRISLAFNLVRQ